MLNLTFKIETMKTLIFLTLKVLEISAFLIVCYAIGLFEEWIGYVDWVGSWPLWIWLPLFIICVVLLVICGIKLWKDWIKVNHKWTEKIKNKFTKNKTS